MSSLRASPTPSRLSPWADVPFIETPLDARYQPDTDTWRLLAPVTYRGDAGIYTVPEGYVTDFATVPRLLWIFMPPSGRWNQAAVIHDWLISEALTGKASEERCIVDPTGDHAIGPPTAVEVDAEFRGALKALRIWLPQRWLMWAGVRWAAPPNPVRRPGWFGDLPLLLLVTLASPVLIVAAVGELLLRPLLKRRNQAR